MGGRGANQGPMLAVLAAVAGVLVLAFALGSANPLSPRGVGTDALGPDSGESAERYVARAAESLRGDDGNTGADAAPRWALVSFVDAMTTADAADAAGGVRISQAQFWSPAAGPQSPIVTVSTGASEDPAALLAAARQAAAGQLREDTSAAVLEGKRAIAVQELSGDCACVVSVLVRGTLDELRTIAAAPGVRAVEALPADARFGRFAVRTLLPGQWS